MKIKILFAVFLIGLISCNREEGSKAHLEVIVLSDSIQALYNESLQQVKNLKIIKSLLENESKEIAYSDSSLNKLIISINEDIASCEGLIEKQKVFINQHKEYLDQHKKTALSVNQIELQHEQIDKDFFTVSRDVLDINQKVFKARLQAKEFIPLEEEVIVE